MCLLFAGVTVGFGLFGSVLYVREGWLVGMVSLCGGLVIRYWLQYSIPGGGERGGVLGGS